MALTSVSRDRAGRLWALLVTYQGEVGCIEPSDATWAENRWQEFEAMLRIDAIQAAKIGQFRLPGTCGVVEVEESQTGGAVSSNQVMVRRTPGGPWEDATASEAEQLAEKDRDDAEVLASQRLQNESLWEAHEAAAARDWDDLAVASEMDQSAEVRTRPLKKFKVRVSVLDKDHNELDTANLTGELEPGDTPHVSFSLQENTVQVQAEEENEQQHQMAANGQECQVGDKGQVEKAEIEDDQAAAGSEREGDDMVDREIADLGSILTTVMGRQWFQLFVDRQVNGEMVAKRWGKGALEVFEINRAMVEEMEH